MEVWKRKSKLQENSCEELACRVGQMFSERGSNKQQANFQVPGAHPTSRPRCRARTRCGASWAAAVRHGVTTKGREQLAQDWAPLAGRRIEWLHAYERPRESDPVSIFSRAASLICLRRQSLRHITLPIGRFRIMNSEWRCKSAISLTGPYLPKSSTHNRYPSYTWLRAPVRTTVLLAVPLRA